MLTGLKFRSKNWAEPLFVACILAQLSLVLTKNCVQIDKCSCEMDDGSGTIDLSKMGKQSGSLIQDAFAGTGDSYGYSFNPCYPFDEGTCLGVAGCQIDFTMSMYYDIGAADKVTFSYDEANDYLVGTYVAGDEQRSSIVNYQCDPTVDPPSGAVHGELAPSTYTFAIVSKYACPQKGPGPDPGPHVDVSGPSISTGWVLVIVFICILSVYLIAGVLFNRLYRKEAGRNVIPNVTLWSAMPGLVKEGFRFSLSKVRRTEYEPIK